MMQAHRIPPCPGCATCRPLGLRDVIAVVFAILGITRRDLIGVVGLVLVAVALIWLLPVAK